MKELPTEPRRAFARNAGRKPTKTRRTFARNAKRIIRKRDAAAGKAVGTHTITLEKAGIYRGKQRFTIAEIPELGTSVTPEIDAARWLLVRGADPADRMLLKYPDGCGHVLELPSCGESIVYREWEMTLAAAAHLYRSWGAGKPDRLVSEEEYEALRRTVPYAAHSATKQSDKIGQETRKQLRRQGILIEDYFDKWRNERAAELQAEAAKWEDGRNYWRPDYIWRKTKHLDKTAYGASMAALLRWQADRVLQDLNPLDRVELRAKEIELGLEKQSKFEKGRIEKGRTPVEAAADWWAKKDKAAAAKEAQEAAEKAQRLRANEYLHAQYGLRIPTDAWTFEFEGRRWYIQFKRGLIDQSKGMPALTPEEVQEEILEEEACERETERKEAQRDLAHAMQSRGWR